LSARGRGCAEYRLTNEYVLERVEKLKGDRGICVLRAEQKVENM